MAEVEVRQEVTQEYEERIAEMEATFARRRLNDVRPPSFSAPSKVVPSVDETF